MKNSTILTLLLFLTVSLSAISQPRYRKGKITLINQDTVSGFVDYTNPWKPTIRLSFMDYQKYDEKIVQSVEFEDGRSLENYKLETTDNSFSDVLAEKIFDGYISLLLYNDKLYLQPEPSSPIVELKEENYKGILAYAMRKRNDLARKSSFAHLNRKQLLSMLSDFHQSEELNYEIPRSKKRPIYLDLTPFFGFSARNVNLVKDNRDIEDQLNNVSSTLSYGLVTDITIPGISKYFSYSFTVERINEVIVDTQYDYLALSFFQLQRAIPLTWSMDMLNYSGGLKFQIPRPGLSPHLGVGFTKSVLLDQKSNYNSRFWIQDNFVGFYLNTGISFDVHPRFRPVFELRYEQLTASTYTGERTRFIQEFNLRNIQANIGLKISLF